MSATLSPLNARSSSLRSLVDMWAMRVASTPHATAYSHRDDRAEDGATWRQISWRQADARVQRIAAALTAFDLCPGKHATIIATTSLDWVLTDMAIMAAGGTTTAVYPTATPQHAAYVLSHSESVIAFTDRRDLAAHLSARRADYPQVRRIVVFGDFGSDDGFVQSIDDFEQEGAARLADNPSLVDDLRSDIGPDQVATLIYTSGTTGEPKGVQLTHDAWVYVAEAMDRLGMISAADKHLLVLPLSHVFAKALSLLMVRLGVPTAVDGRVDRWLDHAGEVQPTCLGAVPRMFEKLYNRVISEARDAGPISWAGLRWALAVGTEVSRLRQKGREPIGWLDLKYRIAKRVVFSRIHDRLGGNLRVLISGSAPLSQQIAEFFHACDLLICEGYGLTETSAANCVNTPDAFKFGTVGMPLPGTEIRVADDGELRIRSRGVMVGYFKNPEATDEALTNDGFLRTGDIGHIDEQGHVTITGRKRNLIVTASGRNVAPAKIQATLEAQSPFISHVLVHGDRRNFCSALITIDDHAVSRWAQSERIPFRDYADLAGRREIRELVQQAIDDVNADLPSHEQIKKFAILPEELTVENGLLTPTMKPKRRAIESRHASILDTFYLGAIERM